MWYRYSLSINLWTLQDGPCKVRHMYCTWYFKWIDILSTRSATNLKSEVPSILKYMVIVLLVIEYRISHVYCMFTVSVFSHTHQCCWMLMVDSHSLVPAGTLTVAVLSCWLEWIALSNPGTCALKSKKQ